MTDDTSDSWLTPTRRRVLSGFAGGSAVSLAGCTGGGSSTEGSDDTTTADDSGGGSQAETDTATSGGEEPVSVSIGIGNGGWDLVPARDTDFDSNKVYTLIYDNVVNLNADAEVVPDLATDWTRESDTQFVFELEEGVTFHNGEEFTAEDVQYTYEWIQNPRKN